MKSEWFDGISRSETGKWFAAFDDWGETFAVEWEAVIARDIQVVEVGGERDKTNLSRVAVRDIIRRGGWTYVQTEHGSERVQELVNLAKLRAEGPLPKIPPARYGRKMKKAKAAKESRFYGVYRAGERWQAKVGKYYISSAPDERVAALMRDVGSLERCLAELNYPFEFVQEASHYGARGLQNVMTLALFIERLDDELARAGTAREAANTGPGEPMVEPGAGTETEGEAGNEPG